MTYNVIKNTRGLKGAERGIRKYINTRASSITQIPKELVDLNIAQLRRYKSNKVKNG
jgi:hypothetical protein